MEGKRFRCFFIVIGLWLMAGTITGYLAHAREESGMSTEKIRESIIAGSWYPGKPQALERTIQKYLDQAGTPSISGQLLALIAPHAGYPYSGPVAAYAYKLLSDQRFDSVIVIAPSHRVRFDGVSVYDQGGYRTPLGVMALDTPLIESLKAKDPRIVHLPQAHTQEHSLEIQVPFLQVMLPDAKLVPLIMGNQDFSTCQRLADTLVDAISGKSVLIVASSDLSHFHTGDTAKKLDSVVIDRINAFDPQGLSKSLAQGQCEACGGGPMVTAMLAAQKLGGNHSKVLKYANSGDVTGDYDRVVGYMAAALWSNPGSHGKKSDKPAQTDAVGLSQAEKEQLHQIARDTIRARLENKALPPLRAETPTLKEKRGAFVTLHKNGALRGCIGNMVGRFPLAETIQKMALAAAFEDPRFPPLQASEFPELDIEISVLSPLRQVQSADAIEVGTHGIYLTRGPYSGVLLPQVASEQKWDRMTFLQQTCRKAGLPPDAWKDANTDIYVFSADIF